MEKPYYVHAAWDDEARVWVASSEDVPGLATEAETAEKAITKSGKARIGAALWRNAARLVRIHGAR